jgi:hypothetical protein
MVQETVPAAKRRPNAHFRELRRARIFTRLREGWPCTEIAREEGLTSRRIRQIVSETLKKRIVDPPTDHAVLQLARFEPALRLAAGAVANGDVRSIRYYLKLLDELDRYQPAAAPQAYDGEARERLYAKLGRIAARSKPRTIKETPAGSPRQAEGGGEARVNQIDAERGASRPIEINPA